MWPSGPTSSRSRVPNLTETSIKINGLQQVLRVSPQRPLIDVLRHNLGLTATRLGCGLGQCGSCTVIINQRPALACQTPMWSLQEHEVITLEGLSQLDPTQALQQAFLQHQAVQCGFCTSGMLMRAQALLLANPQPSADDIAKALHDNLCRCGVQPRVAQAVLQASGQPSQAGHEANTASEADASVTTPQNPASHLAFNLPVPRAPAVIRTYPLLGQWLQIPGQGPDILANTGKVEIGQGISHALQRLISQVLGLPPERVRMRAPSTAHSPDEGVTSGSLSVQDSGAALHLAALQLRALALQAWAKHPDFDAQRTPPYAALAQASWWTCPIDPQPHSHLHPQPGPSGEPGPTTSTDQRDDVRAKVMGSFAFIQDMVLPDMRYGYVGRPHTPRGQIDAVQHAALINRLQALPEVAEVIQDGVLIGVLAHTEHAALQAAALIEEASPWLDQANVPSAQETTAWLKAQPLETTVVHSSHPNAPENIANNDDVSWLEAEFERPYLQHASIGLCCALAHRHPDRLEVWSHTQGIFNLQRDLALALNLQTSNVTVHHVQGAGCYGHNGADDVAFDAAWLATHTPHPVRVMWTRHDEMRHSPLAPAMAVRVRAGVKGGRITHWTQEVWSQGHGTRPGRGNTPALLGAWQTAQPAPVPLAINAAMAVGGGSERNATPPYDITHQHIINHRVLAMPARVSAMRALGAPCNVLAAESMMDMVAEQTQQDVFALRLAHLTDPRARAVLLRLQSLTAQAITATPENGGWGIAYARYKNTGAYCAVWAQVQLDHRVKLKQLVVVADVGRVISETGVRLQLEGGALQAASWTLRERAELNAQGVQTIDWEHYPIDRFEDMPSLSVSLMDAHQDTPLGAGECASGPTTAAVANAVSRALGLRVTSLPLRADRIMELL